MPLVADEARSAGAEQETALHTSGGVSVAGAAHLFSVVEANGGKVEGLVESRKSG